MYLVTFLVNPDESNYCFFRASNLKVIEKLTINNYLNSLDFLKSLPTIFVQSSLIRGKINERINCLYRAAGTYKDMRTSPQHVFRIEGGKIRSKLILIINIAFF